MSYSSRMQKNHLFSVYLAARGNPRMADIGMQIAQQYMSPFDLLIGVVGDAGSGKSVLIRGMFPGLELTNDDEGVNVRPLPLLNTDDQGFFQAHTYHVDIRFEQGFTQLHELADGILEAIANGKRVVVEHFELIYPLLGRNAHLLIGIGEEIIITRPSLFGPDPREISTIVHKSVIYRRMAHTAEDLCEFCLKDRGFLAYEHSDVRRGFILIFNEKPKVDLNELEHEVKELIEKNLPISYLDRTHILIGDQRHYCTGPRMHIKSTGEVKNFSLHKEFLKEDISGRYMVVGLVDTSPNYDINELNQILL